MKKHVVVIISLFFSTLVLANTTQESPEQEKKVDSVDCTPTKPIVKKSFIKKKKSNITKTQKPTVPEILKQEAIIEEKKVDHYIASNEVFHIPRNTEIQPNKVQLFATPIQYSKVDYHLIKEGSTSNLYLIDNRSNNNLDEYYLEKNSFINVTNLNLLNLSFSQKSYTYSQSNPISIINDQNKCVRYFISYKLKDEHNYYQYSDFLNKNDSNSKECLNTLNKIISNNEVTSYNSDFNLINVFFNTAELENQKINFTLHISKDGEPFYPKNISAFALKEDLSEFYLLPIKNKNQVAGIEFSEKVSKGKYFVILNYDYNNESRNFRTLLTVK